MTGCGAIANAKCGMLMGEAMKYAGPGLREVCEAIGIPPVLHLGSCVDNSRVLTVLTQMVAEGGLGDDIADLPVVGFAPEWMSEKALSIGTYFVASGVYTIFGISSPSRKRHLRPCLHTSRQRRNRRGRGGRGGARRRGATRGTVQGGTTVLAGIRSTRHPTSPGWA